MSLVLDKVKKGDFDPDATRSGRFMSHCPKPSRHLLPVEQDGSDKVASESDVSIESPSSASSSSGSSSSNAADEVAKAQR